MHTTTTTAVIVLAFMAGTCASNPVIAMDEPYDITLLEIVGEVHLDQVTADGDRLAVIHKSFELDPSQVEALPPLAPYMFSGQAGASASQSLANAAQLTVGAGGSFHESWLPGYHSYDRISLYLSNSAMCHIHVPVGNATRGEGSAWSLTRFQIDLHEEMIMDLEISTGSRDFHVSSESRESLHDQRWSQLIFEDQTRGETIELIAEGETVRVRESTYRRLKPGKYMITMYNWVEVHAGDSREVLRVVEDDYYYEVRLSESGTVRMLLSKNPLTDLDGDGSVNGKDLALLVGVWGTDGRGTGENGPYMADLDINGKVDGKDLALLIGDWG